MNENLQIILGVLMLASVFLLTRWGVAFKMRSAASKIVADLKKMGSLNPDSAVPLGYEKAQWLKLGLRDYRPKALEHLIAAGVVGRTESGRYYLIYQPTGDI